MDAAILLVSPGDRARILSYLSPGKETFTMTARYPAPRLRAFASQLARRAGLAAERADDVAAILVEGDLMGHTTHGLALLGPYLKSLADGTMAAAGQPE